MNKIFFTFLFFSISSFSAEVYFVSPTDGDEVSSPVEIVFGLRGIGVAPAGINFPNTGHHHLLVDLDALPNLNESIPADENHIHFGKGQTQTLLSLDSGEHTLQLLFGDWMHVPHTEPIFSEKITIFVK